MVDLLATDSYELVDAVINYSSPKPDTEACVVHCVTPFACAFATTDSSACNSSGWRSCSRRQLFATWGARRTSHAVAPRARSSPQQQRRCQGGLTFASDN